MLSRSDLHEYQLRTIEFAKQEGSCGLFLEMGLGKTVSSLTVASDLVQDFEVEKVLIIAPLRVANSVWAQEVCNWSHLHHLSAVICTGAASDRRRALSREADIYIINRENVSWLVEHFGKKWPFDMVIVDESSSFKNYASKRFKALRKVLPYIERTLLLTGTPSPKSLVDLWSQMFLIDRGKRLGKTVTGFKNRFFIKDHMGWNLELRPGAEQEIHGLIADKIMHLSAEDYLQMPERIRVDTRIRLPEKALKAYKDFEKKMFMELEGEPIEALTAATLAGKLLQASSGALYTDEDGNWTNFHDAKLDTLAEIIEDNPNETVLVAYNFKSDLERLKKKFPKAKLLGKDPQTIKDWNAGRIPLLLAHPASAGHGLNLQQGGALCVWFTLNWSLELYQQFNARLHRQGQSRPVRIVHLVCEETIDRRVLSVLADKDATQGKLLEALKKVD